MDLSPRSDAGEDLYRNWADWVTTNLGRDTRLGEIAARAGVDAAERGLGFNNAATAARMAWATATKGPSTVIPSDRDRWERLAFIAWIALVAAWLWPIVTLVLNTATQAGPVAQLFGWDSLDLLQFDRNIALVGVVAFPTLAEIAVSL